MQIGLIGLGKMGGNMAERLRQDGHQVVGYDRNPTSPRDVDSLEALTAALHTPRVVWVMVPSGEPTRATVASLGEVLERLGGLLRADEICVTRIRESVKLAESPAVELDVFRHAPDSRGARDYQALVDELVGAGFVA